MRFIGGLDVAVVNALESLKLGIEYDVNLNRKAYLNEMMGKVLDVARDYKLQVNDYMIWLGEYRLHHMMELKNENKEKGDWWW